MYFWNIDKLTDDLKEWLSEKESFKYFFLSTVLIWIFTSFPTEQYTNLEIVFNLIMVVLDLILLYYTFSINKAEKWHDFIIRSLSISLISVIKSILISLIFLILLWFIGGILFSFNLIPDISHLFDEKNIYFSMFLTGLFTIINYYLTIKYFKILMMKIKKSH
jgi:hypothetical protein